MTKDTKLAIINDWMGYFPCQKFFKDYGGGCITTLWSDEEFLDLIEKRIKEEAKEWEKCEGGTLDDIQG